MSLFVWMLRVWFPAVLSVIKSRDVKVLAVLGYIFHGICRRFSRILSLVLEPISKSDAHDCLIQDYDSFQARV